jgi:hypothetical protein
MRRERHKKRLGLWREDRGVALVEYVVVLPLVLLLLMGTLEVFRLFSVKQSLRGGLKQAATWYSHWRDVPHRISADPHELVRDEMARNPFSVQVHDLRIWPDPVDLEPDPDDPSLPAWGSVFRVVAEADVEFGFIYPFDGGPTITMRESVCTFIDSAPPYYGLRSETPFPLDPAMGP